MASYTFRLNGRQVAADSWDPAQPLLYVLRDQFALHGAKFGCGLGQCGACTVLVRRRCGDCECGVRCDGHSAAQRSVHARAREGGDGGAVDGVGM